MKKEMYSHEIVRTEEDDVTILPVLIMDKLGKFLDKNDLSYRMISTWDNEYQEDWPGMYTFRGHSRATGTIAVLTKVDHECLHEIAEELLLVPIEYI